MDLTWSVIYLLLAYAGLSNAINWYRQLKRDQYQRSLPPAQICQCGDPISLHDEEAGECKAEKRMPVTWGRNPLLDARDRFGDLAHDPDDLDDEVVLESELRPCRCVRYSGPDPEGRFIDLALRRASRKELPKDAAA